MISGTVTALLACGVAAAAAADQPHIIFILADDLGYNDVSWHNADILSPNLAKLASEGVILEQNYVQPLCTPSRSSLLTGRYPFHLGRQRGALLPMQPTGLSVNYTVLPERLRAAGYSTHAVGKWHLGFCAPEYLPLARGFDTFYGFWNAQEDHFTHQTNGAMDLWDGDSPVTDADGVYSADLFAGRAERIITKHDPQKPLFLYLPFANVHQPVQVPPEFEALYPGVKNDVRRVFSGMVTALDVAVARVVTSLKTAGLYNNSVVVFMGDNGGTLNAGGNNWPLRGAKGTIWEGGTRTPAFILSPLLEKTGYVSTEMVHITDWLPTFLRLAGVDSDAESGSGDSFDGVDQWNTLSTGAPSARDEFVYNIDDLGVTLQAALRQGDLKLVWGQNAWNDGWYPVPETVDTPVSVDDVNYPPGLPMFLFNITADPTEKVDLSAEMPEVTSRMQARLKELMEDLVPADYPPQTPDGNPVDGMWQTGWCEPH